MTRETSAWRRKKKRAAAAASGGGERRREAKQSAPFQKQKKKEEEEEAGESYQQGGTRNRGPLIDRSGERQQRGFRAPLLNLAGELRVGGGARLWT